MNEKPKVTVHHVKAPNSDKLDAYVVRLGGIQVFRTGFLRSASAQLEYAKTSAHNTARTLRRAIDAVWTPNERDELEALAITLLPAVIIERAIAHHTSEAEGASRDMLSSPYEDAFIKAELMLEQRETERANAKDEAEPSSAPAPDDVERAS